MIALPPLTGRSSVAFSNSSIGQVVGVAATNIPDPDCVAGYPVTTVSLPVVWTGGSIHELPLPAVDKKGRAFAVNVHGQIVGATGVCESNEYAHPVLWQGGKVRVLPTLGGLMGNVAGGINNQGQIVGQADLPGDQTAHAVLWSGGVVHDLGTLPGDVSSFANAINDRGQVVGVSCDASFNCRGFLWQSGTMYDLNALLPATSTLYLVVASTIDNRSEINGFAYDPNTGTLPAFLASVHPEPTGAAGQRREVPRLTLPQNLQQLLLQRHSAPRGFRR